MLPAALMSKAISKSKTPLARTTTSAPTLRAVGKLMSVPESAYASVHGEALVPSFDEEPSVAT